MPARSLRECLLCVMINCSCSMIYGRMYCRRVTVDKPLLHCVCFVHFTVFRPVATLTATILCRAPVCLQYFIDRCSCRGSNWFVLWLIWGRCRCRPNTIRLIVSYLVHTPAVHVAIEILSKEPVCWLVYQLSHSHTAFWRFLLLACICVLNH